MLVHVCYGVLIAPDEFLKTCYNRSVLVYILKEFRVENGYFHIEIIISATEMLGGSGTCSPKKI